MFVIGLLSPREIFNQQAQWEGELFGSFLSVLAETFPTHHHPLLSCDLFECLTELLTKTVVSKVEFCSWSENAIYANAGFVHKLQNFLLPLWLSKGAWSSSVWILTGTNFCYFFKKIIWWSQLEANWKCLHWGIGKMDELDSEIRSEGYSCCLKLKRERERKEIHTNCCGIIQCFTLHLSRKKFLF